MKMIKATINIERKARKVNGSTRRTLKSGLVVANFNSPHAFYFDDESILNAVMPNFSKETMLDSNDVYTTKRLYTSVTKVFKMSKTCAEALIKICESDVDIVIVPLPVLLLVQNSVKWSATKMETEICLTETQKDIVVSKIATCFVVDRINKIVSSSKFCQ